MRGNCDADGMWGCLGITTAKPCRRGQVMLLCTVTRHYTVGFKLCLCAAAHYADIIVPLGRSAITPGVILTIQHDERSGPSARFSS